MPTDHEALTLTTPEPGVAEITLSRPELLNRFDPLLHRELGEVLRRIAGDREVRAVVLGSTGKAFSAGGDFELMRRAHDDPGFRAELVDEGRELLHAFLELPQPLVVGVQGPAIGLGATVALAGDALIAARGATLADTHVVVGLVAGDGGCLVWPATAGMLRARRHLLTGDPLPAEEAFALGMVTDLVDTPEEVTPAARALAARIAGLPPLAVQGTKRALNRVTQQRAGEVVDLSLAYEERTLASEDLLEGIAAFRERRTPRYRGR